MTVITGIERMPLTPTLRDGTENDTGRLSGM
jgi:hypothetical protein